MTKKMINLNLDSEIVETIEKISNYYGLSKSSTANMCLTAFFRNKERMFPDEFYKLLENCSGINKAIRIFKEAQ